MEGTWGAVGAISAHHDRAVAEVAEEDSSHLEGEETSVAPLNCVSSLLISSVQ